MGAFQCEALSVETGCWLYIGAQHVTASMPFIHYASPRLRREALEDLNLIHNQFNKTINSLLAARRKDALILANSLADTQKQLAESSAQLQVEQSATAVKDDLIAKLQAIIAASKVPE
jgi:hypothetical protein